MWSEDLKALLRIVAEKSIHKTSSNHHAMYPTKKNPVLNPLLRVDVHYHNELKRGKKSIGRAMHCLPQRLTSPFFEIFRVERPRRGQQSENCFQKNVDISLFR